MARPSRPRKKTIAAEDHTIPPILPYSVLRGLVLNRAEYDEEQVRAYVESQAPDEHVTHLEKVKTEQGVNGHSAERVRGYLKAQAKGTWELVSWLVHAEHAVRFDGQLAVDATGSVLAAFGAALVRYERGTPDRCGTCGSYRLTSVYRPDLDVDPPFAILCESCGATAVRTAASGKIVVTSPIGPTQSPELGC